MMPSYDPAGAGTAVQKNVDALMSLFSQSLSEYFNARNIHIEDDELRNHLRESVEQQLAQAKLSELLNPKSVGSLIEQIATAPAGPRSIAVVAGIRAEVEESGGAGFMLPAPGRRRP